MVWSLTTRRDRRHQAGLSGVKWVLRDIGPYLAVIAGFAAAALLVDFCVVCVWQAVR